MLLGSLYDGEIELNGVEYPAADVLLAGMIGYGAANTAFAGLAITLVVRREYGILKRLRSTPLPTATYLGAVLASAVIVFTLQVVALFLLGRFAYDARMPERVGIARGARPARCRRVRRARHRRSRADPLGRRAPRRCSTSSCCRWRSSRVPSAARDYPPVLEAIADVLPLKYYIDLVYAVVPRGASRSGAIPAPIAVVLAWGLAGAIVGARRFGWEPRER